MSMLGNQENLGRGPNLPDRRRQARIQLRTLAYLELDPENGGVIVNISEGGLAFQTAEIITGLVFPRMRFRLPKSNKWLEVSGRLVWEAKSRTEAGIQFIDLNEDVQQQIRSWTQAATLHPDQSKEPGRFKIVWEAEGVVAAEQDSSTQTDLPSELDSMFPSEQALPAARLETQAYRGRPQSHAINRTATENHGQILVTAACLRSSDRASG